MLRRASLTILLSLQPLLFASVVEISQAEGGEIPELFRTADGCMACHNFLVTPSGEDVSIGFDWRASMMANSARDPYWQAAVRREVIDHAESQQAIEDECSLCHMPMQRYRTRVTGRDGAIFAHLPVGRSDSLSDRLAADGVSCTMCHQIAKEHFGEPESFTGHFVVDTERPWGERHIFGPFEIDAGRMRIMQSASRFRQEEASHIRESELCATCHTLYTNALDPAGKVIGRLPEQVPYLEWLHSDYRDGQTCQSCHMPVVRSEMPITSVWGVARAGLSRHVFRAGNFFMPKMLNRFSAELGVEALPQELDKGAHRTIEFLQSEAAVVSIDEAKVSNGRLEIDVTVENLAGHKLPTAYPSRRAWVHLIVRDADGRPVFESGAITESGAIEGNDNDADSSKYEPHHTEIDSPDDVQIYEAILFDPEGEVTTGLLSAVTFGKDNRLLPAGFEKRTAAEQVAVRGAAATDGDFRGGGDRVRYSVRVGGTPGPYRVEAELWYQPIAYRWAHNLGAYDAPLTRRFVSYYESMSSSGAVVLTRDQARVDLP